MDEPDNTTVTDVAAVDDFVNMRGVYAPTAAVDNGEKKISLRDRIRTAQDRKTESVYVEAWDCTFEVQSMTGTQRRDLIGRHVKADGGVMDISGFEMDVILCTAYDPETGELAFQPEDSAWLGDKLAGALMLLADAGLRVSGLDVESAKQAGKASIGIRS